MHSLFLLRLSEELPAALTHALHALCDPESMRGLDLGETRAQLVARRERLILEQEQAAQVLCPSFPLRLIFWTFYSRAHVPHVQITSSFNSIRYGRCSRRSIACVRASARPAR